MVANNYNMIEQNMMAIMVRNQGYKYNITYQGMSGNYPFYTFLCLKLFLRIVSQKLGDTRAVFALLLAVLESEISIVVVKTQTNLIPISSHPYL